MERRCAEKVRPWRSAELDDLGVSGVIAGQGMRHLDRLLQRFARMQARENEAAGGSADREVVTTVCGGEPHPSAAKIDSLVEGF